MFERPKRSAESNLEEARANELGALEADAEISTLRDRLTKAQEEFAHLGARVERFKEQAQSLNGEKLASVNQEIAKSEARREELLELIQNIEAEIQEEGDIHDALEEGSQEASRLFKEGLN